jgi:hypothetical protein
VLTNITIEYPDYLAPTPVDVRGTFRKTLENRARPRMERAVARLQGEARYQKIADRFRLEQASTSDLISFAIVNDHRAARYLIGGVEPFQAGPRNVPIAALKAWAQARGLPESVAYAVQAKIAKEGFRHPGIQPDAPAQRILEDIADDLLASISDGIEVWAARYGAEEAA